MSYSMRVEMMRGAPIRIAPAAAHSRPCCSILSASSSTLKSKEHYQRRASKYWNDFYKRHSNKFFKDRHYLEKDWRHYFSPNHDRSSKVVLEVGCGAGNTIFPLLDAFPTLYVHACDFSPDAISLVKSHEDFREDRLNAFICDLTNNDLCESVAPSSVDVVTLIFTLSAVSPKEMPVILQNLKRVLKPSGYVLFRDYAIGDFAQEKLISRNQIIDDNFCFRGDGTCAYYFSDDFLSTLFENEGFTTTKINVYCKEIVNHYRNITMNRRWVRAVFCNQDPFDSQHTSVVEPNVDIVNR